VLRLTIERRPFDQILARKKRVEYRELKPYWTKRLQRLGYGPVVVHFQNGYTRQARWLRLVLKSVELGVTIIGPCMF